MQIQRNQLETQTQIELHCIEPFIIISMIWTFFFPFFFDMVKFSKTAKNDEGFSSVFLAPTWELFHFC